MIRKLCSLFLIWTFLVIIANTDSAFAQSISKEALNSVKSQQLNTAPTGDKQTKPKTDWNISTRGNVLETPVDFDKISKGNQKPLPRRKISKKQKALWVAVAIGVAALIFLAIKYYRECEIEDPNCDPFYDEYCQCLKYKDKD